PERLPPGTFGVSEAAGVVGAVKSAFRLESVAAGAGVCTGAAAGCEFEQDTTSRALSATAAEKVNRIL
ncbi:hypothetical protein, partial [Paenibacillus validus]|uniref:hypothetical protein n=1 Tax=Paenibacillus validus TaxID=44253 RepID=UPI002E20D57E|nr:hypothetical protein [Paenibacillus validus]